MQPVSEVIGTRGRGRGPWKKEGSQEFNELRRPRTLPPMGGMEIVTSMRFYWRILAQLPKYMWRYRCFRLASAISSNFPRRSPGGGYQISFTRVENMSLSHDTKKSRGKVLYMERYEITRNISGTEQTTTLPPDPGAKGDSVALPRTSRLSAEAKEFVPKYYNVEQFEAGGGGGDAHADTYPIPDHLTENFLSDVIHDLTLNPGHYNSSVTILTDLLLKDLGNIGLYQSIINIIVKKSIILPNFRYNGARLLCQFRDALPDNLQPDFRNILLRRCQDENTTLMENPKDNALQAQGYALFLAELFIQMNVTVGNNERLTILGVGLFEVMTILLSCESCENIKCVCQVLKLAGLALDEQDTRTMDAVFERLIEIQNIYEKESTVRLISSVIKLRQNAWRPPSLLPSAVSASGIENEDMPQFYLPNGDTLSPEESRFLQDNIIPCEEFDEYSEEGTECSPVQSNYEGEDTEDEEFDKAFEAFLAFSQQSKKSS